MLPHSSHLRGLRLADAGAYSGRRHLPGPGPGDLQKPYSPPASPHHPPSDPLCGSSYASADPPTSHAAPECQRWVYPSMYPTRRLHVVSMAGKMPLLAPLWLDLHIVRLSVIHCQCCRELGLLAQRGWRCACWSPAASLCQSSYIGSCRKCCLQTCTSSTSMAARRSLQTPHAAACRNQQVRRHTLVIALPVHCIHSFEGHGTARSFPLAASV